MGEKTGRGRRTKASDRVDLLAARLGKAEARVSALEESLAKMSEVVMSFEPRLAAAHVHKVVEEPLPASGVADGQT